MASDREVIDEGNRPEMSHQGSRPDQPTTLGLKRGDLAVLLVGAPGVGLALGWAAPPLVRWVSRQRWAPWRGAFKAVASWEGTWLTAAFLALGALAGLAFVGVAVYESLRVTITDHDVALRVKDRRRTFGRAEIAAVFVDRSDLVLLAPDTTELARAKHDQQVEALAAAFARHGYPWRDDAPHEADFRRWVDGADGLPPGANAVLKARQRVVEVGDVEDADALKSELAILGVVVRDEKQRQHWRPIARVK